MPAREAIHAAGFDPDFDLGAKDASALINGSTTSLALGALATHDARRLLKQADIAMCLSLEAMRGELAAFDPRVHKARPHPGQARVARNLLRILEGTKRCSQEARDIVFPDEPRQPGQPATPARAGRLFAALHAAGSRARRRGGGICGAHRRNGDEFRHRQSADLR